MGTFDFVQVSSEGDSLLEKLPEAVGFLVVSEDESLLATGSVSFCSLGSEEGEALDLVGRERGSWERQSLRPASSKLFLPRATQHTLLALQARWSLSQLLNSALVMQKPPR